MSLEENGVKSARQRRLYMLLRREGKAHEREKGTALSRDGGGSADRYTRTRSLQQSKKVWVKLMKAPPPPTATDLTRSIEKHLALPLSPRKASLEKRGVPLNSHWISWVCHLPRITCFIFNLPFLHSNSLFLSPPFLSPCRHNRVAFLLATVLFSFDVNTSHQSPRQKCLQRGGLCDSLNNHITLSTSSELYCVTQSALSRDERTREEQLEGRHSRRLFLRTALIQWNERHFQRIITRQTKTDPFVSQLFHWENVTRKNFVFYSLLPSKSSLPLVTMRFPGDLQK